MWRPKSLKASPHLSPRPKSAKAPPLLLLLSGAGTAAVYTTADLVLQGRERDAERAVVGVVGAAIAAAGKEQPSIRAIAVEATPYKPRVRRIYEVGVVTIPLSTASATTVISFIKSLATTGSKGTTVWVGEIIIIDVWWMGRSTEVASAGVA